VSLRWCFTSSACRSSLGDMFVEPLFFCNMLSHACLACIYKSIPSTKSGLKPRFFFTGRCARPWWTWKPCST
jgi:hypothetical protein